jgi:hypothetical protein
MRVKCEAVDDDDDDECTVLKTMMIRSAYLSNDSKQTILV